MKNLTLLVLILFPVLLLSQTQTENYIRTKTYKVETQNGTTNANTQAVLTNNEKAESITYFDGLGRPVQQIAHQQSGTGKDIVTPIEYDGFGRQEKEYLPYVPTAAASLNYKTTALTDVLTFYDNTKYDADFPGMTTANINPYSQKELESSPLNRVLKQAAPGNDWKLGNGHEIKLEYQTNLGNEVKNFGVSLTYANNTYIPTITQSAVNSGFYNANELYKTVTYDENTDATPTELNGSTVEFKNKEGQIVLKRTYGTVGTGTTNQKYDTYYVYDDYGNLTYVLPPKATDIINSTNLPSSLVSAAVVPSASSLSLVATNSITLSNGFHAQAGSTFTASIDNSTQNILDNLCYQYKYDNRNRLVEKKLPGKQWEFIVYDKLDRPVATGPAYSPFNDLTTVGWLITKYDVFSRPVITGWLPGTVTSATRSSLQNTQNSYTANFNETKIATATNSTVNGVAFRYSNIAWPTSGYHVLTVNYFDDYNYPNAPTIAATVEGEPVYYNTTVKPKGLPTGSWIRTLQESTSYAYELSYSLYDKKARPIRSYTTNFLGGYTYTDSKLDFTGKPDSTITYHRRIPSSAELKTKEVFTYSPQGRLLTQTHQIGTGVIELIASNSYDELGQLISKKVGNTTTVPTQKIDYTYNIRGWLKGINNVAALQQTGDPKDLFAFAINYNTIPSGILNVKALYNGNIAETQWATNSDNGMLRSYGYIYDNLNRLKEGLYKKETALDMYNESLTYDKNGNIMSLKRNGNSETVAQQIDNLVYTYANNNNSNQLLKVVDSKPNTTGLIEEFKDNGLTTDDYTYDANGNMLKDLNKGIGTSTTNGIIYNHLNLPTKITFGTAGNIVYIYNAAGQKLQKVFTQGSTTTTTDYLGGYQYSNTLLKFFPTAEGYVEPSGSSYKYVYQYKDHLGNVRLSYDKSLNIQEESNYYPFGLKQKGYNIVSIPSDYKYKFNGKELQDELGLNMYDYGARNYDPALGRWNVMDGKGELYFSSSPYVYASNTPIQAIDPDGNIVIFINGQHGGTGGTPEYWRNYTGRESNFLSMSNKQAFDISVMNRLGDHNPKYVDGAMGGISGMFPNDGPSRGNLSPSRRIQDGYYWGKSQAKEIIANLARDKTTGEIVETIKIITHSMGGAFGKGYVKALKEYIKTLPKEMQYQVRITLVADFDPFQAGSLKADGNIKTQQFKHEGSGNIFGMGWLANENEQGLDAKKDIFTNTGTSTDHSIMTFFNDISKLSEGKYKWNGTSWVKQ